MIPDPVTAAMVAALLGVTRTGLETLLRQTASKRRESAEAGSAPLGLTEFSLQWVARIASSMGVKVAVGDAQNPTPATEPAEFDRVRRYGLNPGPQESEQRFEWPVSGDLPTSSALSDVAPSVWEALGDISDLDARRALVAMFDSARRQAQAGEVDVIMLSARRLACLYELMVAAGYPPIVDCTVVSDRFLDLSPDWTGSNVLILDDSVVVGTTLVVLRDRVRDMVGSTGSVRCTCTCLDVETSATYLIVDLELEPFLMCSAAEVAVFATDVVRTLFRARIPFFSDFPTTVDLKVSSVQWRAYVEDDGWHVADVTAPLLEGEGPTALVLVPKGATINDIRSRLHPSISRLVETFKIRCYDDASATDEMRVRMVPIAMLSTCRQDDLDEALQVIFAETGIDQGRMRLDLQRTDPCAKHRLVQLYASAFVLACNSQGRGWMPQSELLDRNALSLYFGDRIDAAMEMMARIHDLVDQTPVGTHDIPVVAPERPTSSGLLQFAQMRRILNEQREVLALQGVLPTQPQPGELSKIGLIFAHSISSVFGAIGRLYEAAQREEIRDLGSRQAYDDLFGVRGGSVRVLKQGITLRELTEQLAPECLTGPAWSRSLVSLGIDIGNDLGIIVPTTRYDHARGLVYRCYRLGETAGLADRPLPRAARLGEYDALVRHAVSDFPLLSSHRLISVTPDVERPLPIDTALARLKAAVMLAVPGEMKRRYTGVVNTVEDNYVTADLIDDRGAAGSGRVMLNQVRPASDRALLEPGSEFIWLVFADENIDRDVESSSEPGAPKTRDEKDDDGPVETDRGVEFFEYEGNKGDYLISRVRVVKRPSIDVDRWLLQSRHFARSFSATPSGTADDGRLAENASDTRASEDRDL